MSGTVDVRAVMDADRRAVALLSDEYYDAGKSNLAEKWSDHLSVHDEARAAVAELIEAAAELRARQRDYLSQPKGERVEAKGRLVGVAATRLDAALARVRGGRADG